MSCQLTQQRLSGFRRLKTWLAYRGADASYLRPLDDHIEHMIRWIELFEREKHTFL